MELRHLRYFTAVAEELHFARAAERLNISAPTLSHQIRALETMLGARLFTRKTKTSVALTHSGQRFLIEARETLKQAAHAEMVGRQSGRGSIGSIAAGFIFAAGCSGLISSVLPKYRTALPDVSFQLKHMLTFDQFKSLIDGSLDVGFTAALGRYPSGLTGVTVARNPLWAALPEGHRLAARKHVTPAMLVDEDLIAMTVEMETGFSGNIAAITPPGSSPRIVARAPDAFTAILMVAAGVGVSVLSEGLARVAVPGVVYRKITGTDRTADIALVQRTNESAPVVLAFIDFMRAQARLR